MANMVLTVYGDDRAGLVDSVAEVVDDNGGSWDKSYMAELAGKFAGVAAISVPDGRVASLLAGFAALRSEGLDVEAHLVDDGPPPGDFRELHLEVSGQDHPGIIHDISHALAARNISIAELETEVTDAPMGGGTLFLARLTLHASPDTEFEELQTAMASVADQLVVDFELRAAD